MINSPGTIDVFFVNKNTNEIEDYFGRIFKSHTGVTVGDMIQKVRVDSACALLSSTDKNITEIASECGFEDIKFFYSVFKKHKNILPSAYRKQFCIS